MLSFRLVRQKYPQYIANPPPKKKSNRKGEGAGSPSSDSGANDDAKDRDEEKGEDDEKERKQRNEKEDKENDPYYVTWESEDDPMNPQNWSTGKKWGILVLVSLITLVVTFSSSVFSAATELVSMEYGISEETAELGTALYLIGFGIGPLFFGPMSEAFGRSTIYFFTFTAFILCQLGTALGKNPQAILIPRFWAGFFGSTPLSCAGGSISDMFNAYDRTYSFPVFASMPFVGPVIGPLIAGACTLSGMEDLNSVIDWRWTYWLTMIWGGTVLIIMIFFLPETQAPAILMLKARGIRRQTGDQNYYSDMDKRPESNTKLILTAMPKPIILLFTEPIIMAWSLYLIIIYAILYMDFEGYSLLFANDYYRFNLVQVGLALLPIGVGIVVAGASAPLQLLDYKPHYQKAIKEGKPMAPPEYRLRPLMIGGFLVPIGVFWLAWTARPGVYWASPVISGLPFGIGLLIVFLTSYQFLIDCYGPLAASALASVTLARYVTAGGLVMVVRPMYMNLAYSNAAGEEIYAWPVSLLGFLSVVCLPIPFALYFGFGRWLRKRSPNCVKF